MIFTLFLCFSVFYYYFFFFFDVQDLFNSENGKENRGPCWWICERLWNDCDWTIDDNVLFSHDIEYYSYVHSTLVGWQGAALKVFYSEKYAMPTYTKTSWYVFSSLFLFFSGTNTFCRDVFTGVRCDCDDCDTVFIFRQLKIGANWTIGRCGFLPCPHADSDTCSQAKDNWPPLTWWHEWGLWLRRLQKRIIMCEFCSRWVGLLWTISGD